MRELNTAGPILKWAGGKTQLLPELLKIFPESCNTYYEPFIGGGAVFFHLANLNMFKQAVINDWNPELTNLYQEVRSRADLVMAEVDRIGPRVLSLEGYNALRAQKHSALKPGPWFWAARTICLNKACFNGLYRQNKAGEFNVPWGKRSKVTFYEREKVLACATAFQKAVILQGDFEIAIRDAKSGDLVYLDPPYVPLSATSNFKTYTADGFSLQDQTRVRDEFARLANTGVHVVASNSDTPQVRDLYQDFEIRSVQARRNINSKGTGRGSVGEVIIIGGPKLSPGTHPTKKS